ncbi:hypothetical protein [Alkalicoccus luteus]|uniref:Poly A polymerase head domain-containing protein n=1 Tax=Alkalicoccus luteus TaxID=1237094 RepID=A0A969PSX0_9BACI|nr:hypothetical protein [Alkalicoccus luteus]NJP38910.1 hypothetical protein [Alkalicoccus luteus]
MNAAVSSAFNLLNTVKKSGWDSWIVGGAVRDTLMGKEPADVDIVTSATEADWRKLFGRTVRVGQRYDTFLVFSNGNPFEVTPLKGTRIEDDLALRDFTCNAAAFDAGKALIDPFGAERAVKEKRLSAPGDPERMFQRDMLRLFRMIRFELCLGFTPDNRLDKTFRALAGGFDAAPERVQKELSALRPCVVSSALLELVAERTAFLPEPYHLSPDSLIHKHRFDFPLSELAWSLLFTEGNDRKGRKLGYGRRVRKTVARASKAKLTYPWSDEALYRLGEEAASAAAELLPVNKGPVRVAEQFAQLPIKHRRDLALLGEDIALFPASERKNIVEACEKFVLNGGTNERESLLRYAKERRKKWEQKKH